MSVFFGNLGLDIHSFPAWRAAAKWWCGEQAVRFDRLFYTLARLLTGYLYTYAICMVRQVAVCL